MSGERRKWFRFRAVDGNDQAVLCAGGVEHLVQLKNSSAGGFGAFSPEPLAVALGDVLPLATPSGWLEVRVVHLETQGTRTQLGLERVRELASGPRRTWLDAVGGRTGLAMLALAVIAGLVLGGSLFCRGGFPWGLADQGAAVPGR